MALDRTLVPADYTDTYADYDSYSHNWVITEDFALIKTGKSLTAYYGTEDSATVMRTWVAEYAKDYLTARLIGYNKKILEFLFVKDPDYRTSFLDFQAEILKSAMFIGGLQENIAVRNTQDLEQISPAAYQMARARGLLNRNYAIYVSEDEYRNGY